MEVEMLLGFATAKLGPRGLLSDRQATYRGRRCSHWWVFELVH